MISLLCISCLTLFFISYWEGPVPGLETGSSNKLWNALLRGSGDPPNGYTHTCGCLWTWLLRQTSFFVSQRRLQTQSSKPSHKSVYKKSRQFFDFLFCGNMLQLYYMFLMPRGETSHSKTSVTNTNKTATSLRRRLCRAGTSDSPQGALDRPLRNLRWRWRHNKYCGYC